MRKFLCFVWIAAVTLGFSAAHAAPERTTLNLGAAINIGNLPFYAAVDKGFLAKHGIDPKLQLYASGAEMSTALNSGQLDITVAAMSNIPVALERGLKARAFVSFTGSAYTNPADDNLLAIVVRPDSEIKTLADLRGKKVGVTFGATNDLYLQEVLKKHNIPLSALNRINVPLATPVGLFDTGGVAAMVMFEPQNTMMLDKVKGARILLRGGGYVCFCSQVHGLEGRVYKDRALTQKIADAVAETGAWLRDPKNLDEVAQIASRYIRGLDATIAKRIFKYTSFDPRIGKNTYKAFNMSVQQLIAQKKMKAPFDPMKYYDPTFIDNTVKRHPEWFKDLPAVSE
ncbi:MAG: ABC transporter substrate-binding protein [Candidatus Tectomicrobia bacterium]|uniref:ABC transporter substrate-binding protein n=1 Tax=Tectimicrobiota bacterium TaxID=2528274 RepID=A0A932I4G1_UNCTE|nr:ABC transporter substrate-binding protein [Candidatus Tectomicrobia bacterium]